MYRYLEIHFVLIFSKRGKEQLITRTATRETGLARGNVGGGEPPENSGLERRRKRILPRSSDVGESRLINRGSPGWRGYTNIGNVCTPAMAGQISGGLGAGVGGWV